MSSEVALYPPGTPHAGNDDDDGEHEAIPAVATAGHGRANELGLAVQATKAAAKLKTRISNPNQLSKPTRKKLAAKLAQFDLDGNGVIDKIEVRRIVGELVASETKGRNTRLALAALAVVLLLVLACNAGMAYAVVYLTRDTSVDDSALLVDKVSGDPVHTASGVFRLAEDGTLVARVQRFGNDTTDEDTARRRLMSGQGGGVITAASFSNGNGILTAASGDIVSTAALTDGSGVLKSPSGQAVQTQQASYVTELENEGGLEMLFSLPEPAIMSITGWTAEAEDGTEADLDIIGHEMESVIFQADDFLTQEDAATLYDSLPALEDFVIASVEVQQYRLMSSHYKYSMVVVRRQRFLDGKGLGKEGAFFYQGPVLVPRGQEDLYKLRMPAGNATDYDGDNARRHLLARRLLCSWYDVGCWVQKGKDEIVNWFKNQIRSITNFINDALREVREIWNLVESLPGRVAALPEMVLNELKKLPWLPSSPSQIIDPVLSIVATMTPLGGNPPGKCVPYCKIAALGGDAMIFAGNEVILKEEFNYFISTTLSNLQTCFQIRSIEFDTGKIAQFLSDVFNEVIMPLIDQVADALRELLDELLGFLRDAVNGLKSAANDGKRFVESVVNGINGLLGKRRRALLGEEAPETPPCREEINDAVDAMLQATVSTAASRKLLQLEGDGVGPQLPHMFPMHTVLMGRIQMAAEDMFKVGHGAVRRGLSEGIHRRKMLEWTNLLALDKLEVGFAFHWEQTLRLVSNGGQLEYESGDLLELVGNGAPSFPLSEKVERMILPGVTIEGEVLIDLQFPWEVLSEGQVQADITLGVEDMHVAVDVMTGELSASPGDFSANAISVTSNDPSNLGKAYVSGRVEMKVLAVVQLRLCFFGHCIKMETRGRQYYGVGFDATAGSCAAGSDTDCGGGGCASFNNPDSVNYFNTRLTEDVKFPPEAHSCIGDAGSGPFAAGGLWVHAPYPALVGTLDFPGKLAGSLVGGSECDAGDLDEMINELDTQLFRFAPSGGLFSDSMATFCVNAAGEQGGTAASYTAPAITDILPTSTLSRSNLEITYEGCWTEDDGRAFTDMLNEATMEACVAAAIAKGSVRFGLQYPQGYGTNGFIQCWFGDFDATKSQRLDSECKGEPWSPVYKGNAFTYNGDANRNAVYRIGDIGVRYLGCWSEDSGRAFTQVTGDLTMEGCAAWAASLGYDRFGLQHPEGHNDNLVECWTGPFDAGKPRVGDEECKGEGWDPVYQGTTFSYNGRANRNAVYRLGGSAAAFTGCWSDSNGRSLPNSVSDVTMDGCAAAARREGSLLFGLQYPEGYGDDRIECWFGEMDASREQRPDEECKGEDWLPRLNGEKAPFNGAASRNAIYALDPGPARYVGCWSEGAGRAFPVIIRDVTMEGCAAAALAEGSARFGLQYPEGYGDNRIECWYGAFDASKPRVDNSECKAEGWDPTYRGFTFKYNGAGSINAVYQLAAPARYMGCYSEDSGRAFSDVVQGVTMEACAAATRAKGSAWFGLQYPQGHAGETVECWIGAFDAGKPKVADSECKGEGWNPTAWGLQYKYNGAGHRNAVYVLTQPARYVGCWSESPGRVFSTVISGVTMETCAAAALGAGSSRFGLQHPAGFSGEEVECWFGEFNPNLGAKVADSACKGESWNPSLHGASFTYNGAGGHNAVYEFFG
eukprot:jgi/Tetstr1/466492/TSEL_010999.t1